MLDYLTLLKRPVRNHIWEVGTLVQNVQNPQLKKHERDGLVKRGTKKSFRQRGFSKRSIPV